MVFFDSSYIDITQCREEDEEGWWTYGWEIYKKQIKEIKKWPHLSYVELQKQISNGQVKGVL